MSTLAPSGRKAAALVEVCCALGLAAVVLVVVAQLLSAAGKQRGAIDLRTRALVEAGNAAERVAALRLGAPLDEQLAAIRLSPSGAELPQGKLEITAAPEGAVDPAPDSAVGPAPSDGQRIAIRVSWEAAPGQRADVVLVTWLFPESPSP